MPAAYQDPRTVALSEPRILMLKSILEAVLQVIELEQDGDPVQVDAFRLRHLRDWVTPYGGRLAPTMLLDGIAPGCNVSCRFCFIRGNPPHWNPRPTAHDDIMSELRTRLRYYDEEAGKALFRSIIQWYEPFASRHAIDALRLIRQQSEKWISLTTNGRGLTRSVVAELAKLKPVYVVVSLNSADQQVRRDLMQDREPQIAIDSLRWLREHEIPFAVSCVPWPTAPMATFEACLRAGDAAGAESLRVSLPGYTRYNGDSARWFDTSRYWADVIQVLAPLREELDAPILFCPFLFEESLMNGPRNQPIVIGTGRNSPARAAGFVAGDLLLEVNGTRVISRPHARDLLSSAARAAADRVNCTVRRREDLLTLTMNEIHDFAKHGYPYASEYGTSNETLAWISTEESLPNN